ncbi:DDB1-and CUL4-associated factor 4 [Nephila pilipes]|uniref:DDB1-and CUL4-associated factor 4 n=1 Tax=Nephila pilipes TaxID=299642 RepID=A0A8X6MY18_NEPPI|nr:DDB1-and CUL4-associated factor 4 [Nephila pilipes]
MDVDDEITEDFLRMQGRQWHVHGSIESGECNYEFGSPFRKKRSDIARSGRKYLTMNVHCGKATRNVNFSVPGFLVYRENGMVSPCDYDIQVLSLKLKQLKLVSSSRVDFSDYVNCYYVKGFKKDLIGAWTYHEYSATLLKSISFQYAKLDSKNNKLQTSIADVNCADIVTLPSYKVFDICGLSCGDQDYVLYVANSYSRHKNIAHLAPIGVNEWGDQQDDIVRRFEHQEILWSCAWNNYRQRFAIGADRCFYLHDYESFSKKIDLPKGQPYSLDFNGIGSMLYCGLHSGDLLCFDLREDSTVPSLTVPLSKNISYIKLLSDEQTVITSGFNSVLFNVDLRTKRAVFQYPNHYSLYKKLIFSLDENLNVLCAPGEDNITRLWSLKEGKLLHALPLPNQDYCGQINSFFEAEGRRIFVHILLGDSIHTYETLEDTVQDRQVLQLNARPLY